MQAEKALPRDRKKHTHPETCKVARGGVSSSSSSSSNNSSSLTQPVRELSTLIFTVLHLRLAVGELFNRGKWKKKRQHLGLFPSYFTCEQRQTDRPGQRSSMGAYEEKKETCGTICLKYLLFTFNFLFWLAGGVVMAVGVWTLVEKSDYISLLSSKTYAASAYILVLAGAIVMVTGVLGCCATFKEQRKLLRVYFVLLLCIFLLEVLAGVLAYIYYQQLNEELKQNLKETMTKKYKQEGNEDITDAVDKLQQEFKCCGSNNSSDWAASIWIRSRESDLREVPDSCCKSPTELCGRRDHPSNIYKVEGGCISKLETFILDHLKIIGAVGVGIACVQIIGMVFTCCLYRSLKAEPY